MSSIFGLLVFGKFLEPIWTSREFLKFIIFVNTTTLIGVYVTAVAFYHITRRETFLYVPLSGFHGVLPGFLVAVKQIAPEQDIEVLGWFDIRAEWLPSLFILMSVTISIVTSDAMRYSPFVLCGTYWGWLYLRYIQRIPESNITGTPGDEFALSTFFPGFIRPVIDVFTSSLDKLLCQNCNPWGEHGDHSDRFLMHSFDTSEASRWRERGSRVLEEGLHDSRNNLASEDQESSERGYFGL
ncbi:rhomboid-like protein 19 [Phoenix dactylifera]|uniref:Rhomboid-like protein 19 n=1 Tax=Phoenix dactylifera TaxID=42345 RepID=A0A8B9AYT5_PHODC|nr:rhomboid-like protein 19 [Phoenix dactylifera]